MTNHPLINVGRLFNNTPHLSAPLILLMQCATTNHQLLWKVYLGAQCIIGAIIPQHRWQWSQLKSCNPITRNPLKGTYGPSPHCFLHLPIPQLLILDPPSPRSLIMIYICLHKLYTSHRCCSLLYPHLTLILFLDIIELFSCNSVHLRHSHTVST